MHQPFYMFLSVPSLNLYIYLPTDNMDQGDGLCGNYNGDRSDDIRGDRNNNNVAAETFTDVYK